MIPQDGPDSYACVGYRHIPCCDLSKPGHNSHVLDSCDHWTPPWCEACGAEWPCDAAVYEKKAERLAAELTDRDALIKDHLAKIMHLENRVEAEAHRADSGGKVCEACGCPEFECSACGRERE